MYTIDDPSLAEHDHDEGASGIVGLLARPYLSGEYTDEVFSLRDEELYANALVLRAVGNGRRDAAIPGAGGDGGGSRTWRLRTGSSASRSS